MTDVAQSEIRKDGAVAANEAIENDNASQKKDNAPSDPLFGQAHELKEAGFKPMPGQRAAEADKQTIDVAGAASELAVERADVPMLPRAYTDGFGEIADPNEAISLERAAHDLSRIRETEKDYREKKAAKSVAARVDKFRGDAIGKDAAAVALYGLDATDEAKASEGAREPGKGAQDSDGVAAKLHDKTVSKDAESAEDQGGNEPRERLDPVVEQALKHPQVRKAIAEELDAAEGMRHGYVQALGAAADIARASFLDQFPELAGMSPEQMPAALQAMSQHDPQRYNRVRALVERVSLLESNRLQEQQHDAVRARQQFEHYARSEDARFEKMIAGIPREQVARAANEILNAAEDYGYDRKSFMELMRSNPTLRSAPIQKMMLDAASYRLAQKAAPAAIPKSVPPVQRPGVTNGRSERATENVRSLATRFSGQPTLKNAADLLVAHRRSQSR